MAITPRFLALAAGSANSSKRPLREALRAICTQSRSWRSIACGHHFSVGVTGHAGKARHFLFAGFHQALQRAVWGLDFRQIVGLAEAVDVDEIDMIGLQAFQTCFQPAQEFVAGAIRNLRGQPDIFAARGHHAADAGFALAIAVGVSGVEIRDAEIDRAIEDRGGACLRLCTSGSDCRNRRRESKLSRRFARECARESRRPGRALATSFRSKRLVPAAVPSPMFSRNCLREISLLMIPPDRYRCILSLREYFC